MLDDAQADLSDQPEIKRRRRKQFPRFPDLTPEELGERIEAILASHIENFRDTRLPPDRIDAAREAVHQWIEFQPWQTIARTKRTLSRWYSPEISPEITEMYVEGLRKAGMPQE